MTQTREVIGPPVLTPLRVHGVTHGPGRDGMIAGPMIVEAYYRGFRIEVHAELVDGAWDAKVRSPSRDIDASHRCAYPVAHAHAAAAARDRRRIPRRRLAPRAVTSRGRVLVVDDEPAVLDTLRDMLEEMGYEASTAASGEQAIAAIATVQPHVVFLDLRMPGISGLEALTYFRQHHRTVPVIVISGDTGQESAQKARAGGAFDLIAKPFAMATLQSLVAQAMRLAPRPRPSN
jgi:CheY-like chemotaxis protein